MSVDTTVLCLPLPEDVTKAKWHGDFTRALKLIEHHLNDSRFPEVMKKRLVLERDILRDLPIEYPYSLDEGLKIIHEEIPDFTKEELIELVDEDKADWIYVNGEIHLSNRFYQTLKKVYPAIAKRAGIEKTDENFIFLEEEMNKVKNKGSNSYHFRIRASVEIKEDAFIPNKEVTVHLPIPMECDNIQNVHIISYTECKDVTISDLKTSRTICFKEVLKENHPFYVEYEYDCISRYHVLNANDVTEKIGKPLEETWPAIVYTPLLKALAKEIIGNETNKLVVARKFYNFCTTQVTYSYMRKYLLLTNIVDYVGAGLKGDCGVQAILFITLCRYVGIPAHFQSGLYTAKGEIGNHDWAMFYIEPYGWLFADCSFGGSAYRGGKKELHDYYFGNLDPFRMVANNDICAEFDPPKKFLRFDPYDNQVGEIEYEDRELRKEEIEHHETLLETIEKI